MEKKGKPTEINKAAFCHKWMGQGIGPSIPLTTSLDTKLKKNYYIFWD